MKLKKLLNEPFSSAIPAVLLSLACMVASGVVNAQTVDDIRWKSADQVKAILGEPISSTPPVGTHATYTLWQYETFTVAFANNHAFHMFDKNSLKRFELEENRADDEAL